MRNLSRGPGVGLLSGASPGERKDETKNRVMSSDCIWQNGDQVGAGHRPRQISQGGGETAAKELPTVRPRAVACVGAR